MLDFMEIAVEEGWRYQLLTYPNPAVGAVGVINGKVFKFAHRRAGEVHAELGLCWEIFRYFNPDAPELSDPFQIFDHLISHHRGLFHQLELYVTLEPCNHTGKTPSCAKLLSYLKPRKVVIGELDPIPTHGGGVERLKRAGIEVEVRPDQKTALLLEPFKKWQRGRFVLFKQGQGLNGGVTGGYITSPQSLEWVHRLRELVGLIVVGGETVRTDLPRLDTRLASGLNPPDVLIYTHSSARLPSAPLFQVAGRRVFTSSSLDLLSDYNFVLIEGGPSLFWQVADEVDWYLSIVAPKLVAGKGVLPPSTIDLVPIKVVELKGNRDLFFYYRR